MTTLTDREKALYDAVAGYFEPNWREMAKAHEPLGNSMTNKVLSALRAYDPPKEKVPVLPTFDDFIPPIGWLKQKNGMGQKWLSKSGSDDIVRDFHWDLIREATAKEQE